MKLNTSFLKRCIALAVALVLLVSSSNLGSVLRAFAVEDESVTITDGQLVAKSYELTAAEKALLSSGLLKGTDVKHTYTVPTSDELVDIKLGKQGVTIKAGYYEEWKPVAVRIIVDGKTEKTGVFEDGKNEITIAYNGDAFTVEVDYELNYVVDKEAQYNMLHAAAWIKAAMQAMADVKGLEDSLAKVESAMSALDLIVNNGIASEPEKFENAVNKLKEQINEGGKLQLRVLNEIYVDSVTHASVIANVYRTYVKETYECLSVIQNDGVLGNSILLGLLPAEAKTQLAMFEGVLNGLISKLETISQVDWSLAEKSVLMDNLSEEQDALLKGFIASIDQTTEVEMSEIQETLNAEKTIISKNKSLVRVNVSVVLNAVQDNSVVESGKVTGSVDLPEGATKAEIVKAINDKGIVADAKAAWKLYKEGYFVEKTEGLVDSLTKDINVTITFSPKNYKVTYSYGAAEELPYGYKLTLPMHDDAKLAYDYLVDGTTSYMQGKIITITGETNVTRTEGPAYLDTTLYQVIAESFGGKAAYEVMKTGVLKGDEPIFYREPAINAEMMTLKDGYLTAPSINYYGFAWKPYSYSFDEEVRLFNGSTTVACDWEQATVKHVLTIKEATPAKVAEVLAMLTKVKSDFDGQKAGMDRLNFYKNDTEKLMLTVMYALQGIISNFTFDDDNAAKNQELRDHFLNVLMNKIVPECMTGNYLTIVEIINGYNYGGMAYYFKNSEKIRKEVSLLSSYVNELICDQEKYDAMAKLMADPGLAAFGLNGYEEKLQDLADGMESIAIQLAPVDEAIDLENENLPKLIEKLSAAIDIRDPGSNEYGFVLSDGVAVQDESYRMVSADIFVDGVKIGTVNTNSIPRGDILTQGLIDALEKKIQGAVNADIGNVIKYYTFTEEGRAELNNNIGNPLNDNIKIAVKYEAKTYYADIWENGNFVSREEVSVNDLTISLPKYDNTTSAPDEYWTYYYTIGDEKDISGTDTFTFSFDDLDTLFKNSNVCKIVREARDIKLQTWNTFMSAMNAGGNEFKLVTDKNGQKLVASIGLNPSNIEALGMGFVMGGYSYIAMDGEPFMDNPGDGLEISLQTVLDAILNDPTFSNKTIIDLGKNNGGKVLRTTLQLGMGKDEIMENLVFELHLNAVPAEMIPVANALNAIKNNFSFKANNGKLDVDLTLPEKVYEIYLTALLVAGEVDTNDINAIDNEIAFRFLYDYVEFVLGNEKITSTTFQNTLEMLDKIAFDKIPNYDLNAYAKHLEALRKVYNNVEITADGEQPVSFKVSATGSVLNRIINSLGIDLSSMESFFNLVKELKVSNADKVVLNATAEVKLTNTVKDFEAVIIDVDAAIEGGKELVGAYKNGALKSEAVDLLKGKGLANAADYTSNLADRLTTVTGPAAIYLLSDVEGDLVINTTTVLDLNGFTVKGDIIVNGKLLIVDSTIDTDDCGWVEGEISGNAFIVAGNYKTNVSKFLMDGYKQVGTSVQNAMYTFEVVGDSITLVLNSDFMDECDGWLPTIRALAADIAVDLALNFYIPASLTNVYGIGDNFNDILGLLNRHDAGEIADLALSLIDVEGISDIANAIIADMMKFGAIADAIDNEKPMGGYTLTTMPWAVEFMHVYEEGVSDYLTVGIVAKDEAVKSTTVNIKLVGDNIKRVVALLRELDRIVVDEETFVNIDVKQPVRDGKFVNIAGSAEAQLSVDLTVDKEYQTVLAVIFAYGTPAKANALISALGDENALNAAFNDMTVREIIKSLGAMSRTVSFAQMAAAVGADITAEAAELESLYHFVACAAGKALAKLESMNINGLVDRAENAADKAVDKFESYDDKELPTRFGDVAEKILDKLDLTTLKPIFDKAGNVIDRVIAKVDLDSKLGALDQGDGSYILQYAYSRAGDVEVRGYGVNYNVENISGLIKVKVFDLVDCLWGDANHDGEVNAKDASFVLQYSAGVIDADQYFCTLRTDVNDDGEINAKDASLILQHTAGNISKFPVEG